MSVSKALEKNGLTRYQQLLFTAILQENELTARKLCVSTKVPFGKVYDELEVLVRKGLIEVSNERPKKYFITNPKKVILKILDEERESIDEIEKQALDEIGKSQQVAEIFHTKAEIRQSQIDSFKWSKEEVCQCLGTIHKPVENKDLKSIYEKEIELAIKRGVIFKALYQKNQKPPQTIVNFCKKYPRQFQIRFSDFSIPRFDIVDSIQILFKIQDPMDTTTTLGTTVIQNSSFARKLRQKFMTLWHNSEEFV